MNKWKILIADDDEQTHLVTMLALSNISIFGREIEFYQAFNSREAYDILEKNRDMTVILLDVIMETENAGLELVRKIREDLALASLRIIIRTGQPGDSPELKVIQEYDINDYKNKSELTRARLLSSLISAIRSYEHYQTLERNKSGLEKIITGSRDLFVCRSIDDFSKQIIDRLGSILESSECSISIFIKEKSEVYRLRESSGKDRGNKGDTFENLGELERESAEQCVSEGKTFFSDRKAYIFLPNDHVHTGLIIITSDKRIEAQEQQLLKIFAIQISVGYENQYLLDKLNRSAYYDTLSSLPNRTSFIEEIFNRWKARGRENIALLDVIQFAEINNSMGYHVGDFLLQSVARRLNESLDSRCFLSRIGGDNFGIIGPRSIVTPEFLLSLFNEPFRIDNEIYPVKATIGIIELDMPGVAPDELLQKADMALRTAKREEGTLFHYYDREMDRLARNRIDITKELKQAIDRDELLLHFQPQLNLNTKNLSGVESLIRWKKGSGELIPPSQFIPIAEQSGLIINLGEIAFKKSLKFLSEWITEGLKPFRIAINVSVRQLLDNNFRRLLSEELEKFPGEPSFIELEITESILMHDVEKGISILKYAKDLGMSIAIDDFGTGFSSLSYLQKLPIDRLKIDRSFIMNLESDTKARELIRMIVRLAKQMNLDLIAEGVENDKQMGFLSKLECDEVQGFLFSKPLSEDDFKLWAVRNHQLGY